MFRAAFDGAVTDGAGADRFWAETDGLAEPGEMPRGVAFAADDDFLAGLPLAS
jgi:hypothetical protein